jgi:hypothetical protein
MNAEIIYAYGLLMIVWIKLTEINEFNLKNIRSIFVYDICIYMQINSLWIQDKDFYWI